MALTDTLYNDFTGATSGTAGAHGLVIAPAAGDQLKALYGDGTWKLAHMTIAAYGKSTYAEILAAYQANNIIYCRASSNSNPGTGNQLRMAFLAYVNNETTPTEFEFQYYRSVATHTDAQQGDQVYVYKINSAGTWSVTVREAYTKVKAGTNMTSSYSSGTITLNATDTTYSDFTGATSGTAGAHGLVPQPAAGDQDKVLKGDGTWDKLDPDSLENTQLYDRFANIEGTEIVSSSNLNTRAFLDPGIYYTMSDSVTATLTNCPTTEAITMRVYVPFRGTIPDIDNDTHVYLLREITTHTGKVYTQQVNSGSTPGVFTYKDWYRKVDSREIKSLTTQSDAGWSADKDKIPDISMISYWNGAYSGTNSNLKYLASNSVTTANVQDGAITSNKLNDFNTANTADTWVPVGNSGKLQHRVIKPFNSDGSIPRTAMGFDTPTVEALNSNTTNTGYWKKLCSLTVDTHAQGQFVYLKIFLGWGNNGYSYQNAYIDLIGQMGWTGTATLQGRYGWSATLHQMESNVRTTNTKLKIIAPDIYHYDIWLWVNNTYVRPNVMFFPTNKVDGSTEQNVTCDIYYSGAWQSTEPTGTECQVSYQEEAVGNKFVSVAENATTYSIKSLYCRPANNAFLHQMLVQTVFGSAPKFYVVAWTGAGSVYQSDLTGGGNLTLTLDTFTENRSYVDMTLTFPQTCYGGVRIISLD